MPVSINDVANYFLVTQPKEEPDITNMKLQKLCAYAQALSLCLLDHPLFPEKLEGWPLGPVSPELYNRYAKHHENILPIPKISEDATLEPFDEEEKFILSLTWSSYGEITASGLSTRSHADFPGKFNNDRLLISQMAIKRKFANNPLVQKIKHMEPCHYNPETDKLVSEKEVMDALEI